VLYGVSVLGCTGDTERIDLLRRFPRAPAYVEARVGRLREAGFEVIPTGTDIHHFDVQLVNNVSENAVQPTTVELEAVAARLLSAAGKLHSNPAYAGASEQSSEER
jgi:hypothetical protein